MKITAILSWIVILLICIAIPTRLAMRDRDAATQPTTDGELSMPVLFTAKNLVGMERVVPGATTQPNPISGESPLDSLHKTAKTGSDQIAVAVVEGEFLGREVAVEQLAQIGTPDAEAFIDLYVSGKPLEPAVVDQYDFIARLAGVQGKNADDPARQGVRSEATRALVAMYTFFGVAVIANVVGAGLLITAIVLLALGKVLFRVNPPGEARTAYIEAFALYLLTMMGGSMAVRLLLPDAGMSASLVPMFASALIGVVWPILRGVPYATLREDWGLHAGKNVFVEMLAGAGGYLAGLPIIIAGAAIAFLLANRFGAQVSHPIGDAFRHAPFLLMFMAVVLAPLFEETLFRGALLSHLRGTWGIVVSAIISGVIFAAIHPQGWAGIPVLASIGAILAVIRQWRGSLVASMTAHAINNGAVTLLLYFMTV